MRIAQIAPLFESVPPRLYGGTERVVCHLTEELVRRGHDVTLFASGDSRTSARLVATCRRALWRDRDAPDWVPAHAAMLEEVHRRLDAFDVLHFHTDRLHLPLFRDVARRTLTTLHGRLDLPELAPFFREFADVPLSSISLAQRLPLPEVRWVGNVHHGIPPTLLRPRPAPGDHLVFLGRISAEKRPDHAVEIARRAGRRLRVAAKVDPADADYFETHVRHLLDDPLVDYIGEIGDAEKSDFLGGAAALVFPIDWPEPFGLVLIEAMACGTPVIAYRRGSVPEIVEDGVTGFIVDDLDGAVVAVQRLPELDRNRVRRRFEERFTSERMAADYEHLYLHLAAGAPSP